MNWQIVDIDLELGDMLVLFAGADESLVDAAVVATAVTAAGSERPASEMARAIGEYLVDPSGWPAASKRTETRSARWHVVSRGAIAVLKVTA